MSERQSVGGFLASVPITNSPLGSWVFDSFLQP